MGKFAYFIVRFLLSSFIVKSDKAIGLFWNQEKVITDKLGLRQVSHSFTISKGMLAAWGRVRLLSLSSISKFSSKLIRLLFHSPVIKSDNEIDKFSYRNMEYLTRTPPRTFLLDFWKCLPRFYRVFKLDLSQNKMLIRPILGLYAWIITKWCNSVPTYYMQ